MSLFLLDASFIAYLTSPVFLFFPFQAWPFLVVLLGVALAREQGVQRGALEEQVVAQLARVLAAQRLEVVAVLARHAVAAALADVVLQIGADFVPVHVRPRGCLVGGDVALR